jgi:hypothetical protein
VPEYLRILLWLGVVVVFLRWPWLGFLSAVAIVSVSASLTRLPATPLQAVQDDVSRYVPPTPLTRMRLPPTPQAFQGDVNRYAPPTRGSFVTGQGRRGRVLVPPCNERPRLRPRTESDGSSRARYWIRLGHEILKAVREETECGRHGHPRHPREKDRLSKDLERLESEPDSGSDHGSIFHRIVDHIERGAVDLRPFR